MYLRNTRMQCEDKEVYYIPNFMAVEVCENFENNCVDLSEVTIATSPSSEGGAVGLSGNMSLLSDIGDGYYISLSIEKLSEMTTETLLNSKISLCEAVKDENAPWYPLMQDLGITGCPVISQVYPIGYFAISLEPYANMLTRDTCGEYIIGVCIEQERDKISCHKLGLEIVEKNDD
ncbi:hypothetical protein ACJJTC_010771 [Scirpophaga incertulas]